MSAEETFHYRNGELYCEQVSVRRLAEQFGTPLYVYSQSHFVGRFQSLDRAFANQDHLVCFAMKANSNLAVLRALANEGAGFDTVSAGELNRVVRAGGDPSKCVFAGVGKTRDEIAYALKLGIYAFNVESESELRVIDATARQLGRRAPIAVRVNPGVDPHTHQYISTGKDENKFGIALDRALEVYRAARGMAGVEIRGVQVHIGSQLTTTAPFVKAIKKMMPLIRAVRELAPDTLKFFDIGGGLGIRYRNEKPPTAADYAAAVLPSLREIGLKVLMEMGRFIVGDAGILVSRVIYVKSTPVKTFVITDAGMNDLIRPALYGSHHEIVPVRHSRAKPIRADIVGPVCESGDFFGQGRKIAPLAEGDLLAVNCAGAYGMVMASNYNSRPRPAEVLVRGRRSELIRRRETMKDLVRGEMVPQWLE